MTISWTSPAFRRFGAAFLALVSAASVGLPPLGAQTPETSQTFTFGRAAGWKDFPVLTGTGTQRAPDGTLDLVLAAPEYQADETTDLLLHFNDRLRDEASQYRVTPDQELVQRGFGALGGGSAVFRGTNPLVLQASGDALFQAGRSWGDVTIEFWLYPSQVADGATVFEWTGGRTSTGTYEAQGLRAAFEGSRLVWTFQGLFASSPAEKAVDLAVRGTTRLVPKTWHHHLLRYRAETGLLEYLVDGKTEGLVHATPSGTEDGRPYGLVIGPRTRGEVSLGNRLQGAVDELRVSAGWVEEPQLDRFLAGFAEKGTAISRILDLRFPGSAVSTVAVRAGTPGDSSLVWSYRMADTIRFQWTFSGTTERSLAAPEVEEDSWIRFQPGEDLSRKAAGRYLQLRVDLLPSGTGADTPRVNQITVTALPSPPPPAPAAFEAFAGDGQVTLRWKPVLQGAPDGYLVFFGPRPGQTRGTVAVQGTSPLDVGKVTETVLSGLSNDQIYYISVAAYRSTAVGPLSREVAVRPQRKAP